MIRNNMTGVSMTALLTVGLTIGLLAGTAGSVQASDEKTFQSANMIDFDFNTLNGGGTLTRSEKRISVRLATSGLDADSAYTVWWVIFNNPEECDGSCGEADVGNPDVEASVVYAAGFLTGVDGIANVTAHLDAGDPPSGIDIFRSQGGLNKKNGFGAEVHLIVRGHGVLIPGSVGAQISSFGGGCGTNDCVDQQAIVFSPVEVDDDDDDD